MKVLVFLRYSYSASQNCSSCLIANNKTKRKSHFSGNIFSVDHFGSDTGQKFGAKFASTGFFRKGLQICCARRKIDLVAFAVVLYLQSKAHLIMSALNISKKRKFVADGVFYSELNEVNFPLLSI